MANDTHLLTDIRLDGIEAPEQFRERYARAFPVKVREFRLQQKPQLLQDFDTISGRYNLAQAIVIRVLTPRGELEPLGHPEYGSRLYELIGERNTATTRNLLKLFILEALQQEPRIERKINVVVTPAELNPPPVGKGARNVTLAFRVDVQITVQPVGETETVTIGPFTLELEP